MSERKHSKVLMVDSASPLTLSGLLRLGEGGGLAPWERQLVIEQRASLFALAWDREHPPSFLAWVEVLEWMRRALGAANVGSSDGPTREFWRANDRDGPALLAFKWREGAPPNVAAWMTLQRGLVAGRDLAELAAQERKAERRG